MKWIGCCVLLAVVVTGCHKKTSQIAPIQIVDTGLDIRINDIELLNDTTWLACGGIRDVSGYILRSEDKGKSWERYPSEFPKSIYCLKFRDAVHGFAGGDFLHMWSTDDGGQSWNFYWLGDQVPFNGEDRPAIRDFEFTSDSNWYFCGGENLGEGVLYSSVNAGSTWEFAQTEHEMRCIEKKENNTLIAAGHGAIWTLQQSVSDAIQKDFSDDFLTSSTRLSDGRVLFCSYNGKIYEVSAEGYSINEKINGNRVFGKRINWNAIHAYDGEIRVCGNDGMIAESKDEGATWTLFQLTNEPHLFSLDANQSGWWAGGENGKLYQIK